VLLTARERSLGLFLPIFGRAPCRLRASPTTRPFGLCPNCAQEERVPDHSSALRRTMTGSTDCTVRISAHFAVSWSRTENPGVGGSIPSLPTIFWGG